MLDNWRVKDIENLIQRIFFWLWEQVGLLVFFINQSLPLVYHVSIVFWFGDDTNHFIPLVSVNPQERMIPVPLATQPPFFHAMNQRLGENFQL